MIKPVSDAVRDALPKGKVNYQLLGETDEARKWFDAGVQWMEDHGMGVTQRADLTRWRDEARAVLGV